jgi:hypothetical protein
VPSAVEPSKKLTVPVGTDPFPLTVTVTVTGDPMRAILADVVRVAVGFALFTVRAVGADDAAI